MSTISMEPIGKVHSSRPIVSDDHWDREQAHIELDEARFQPDALQGLDAFSYVIVVFQLDRIDPDKVDTGARNPRNNPNWPKVGIFAQRAKTRPNRIGVTVCQVVKVEGRQIHVKGLDAIDGTPVLDIKPWVKEFGPRGNVSQPTWVTELMTQYWSAPPPK